MISLDKSEHWRKAPFPFSCIMVTGAEGFVGKQLVDAISGQLAPAARLILTTRSRALPQTDKLSWIKLDLENAEAVFSTLRNATPDLVIHLAAQSSVAQSVTAAANTWSTNLVGSLHLARAIADTSPNCTVLFASSVEVYGLTFNNEVASETSPLRPQSVYARSKAAAELMFADVLPSTARLIVARPANHSGPGQDESFVIPSFAAQIARAERNMQASIRVGNLDAERDFLDARDVISAYISLIEHAALLPRLSTFNIASGRAIKIGYILDRLRSLSGNTCFVEQDIGRLRPSEVRRAVVDATALRDATGWEPVHNLDDMLSQILIRQRERASMTCSPFSRR